jgi:hypothetical protein
MAEENDLQQARINAEIEVVRRRYGNGIRELLKEINTARLKSKGKLTTIPITEGSSLRWTLAWTDEHKILFELSIIVNIEDDGHQARVGRVWVHRHASAPLDYEGHTPTTRMRRLAGLSLADLREAIDAEWV